LRNLNILENGQATLIDEDRLVVSLACWLLYLSTLVVVVVPSL